MSDADLNSQISAYLCRSGLEYSREDNLYFVGPLAVFVGPLGAEVFFRNLSQRSRISSQPAEPLTTDKDRKNWVVVVQPTKDPSKVIGYIEDLLIPADKHVIGSEGATMLKYKGNFYVEAGKAKQFGNPKPQQVEKVHPHGGPTCIKKDPSSGHCLKWGRPRKAKPKMKKTKTPKWK